MVFGLIFFAALSLAWLAVWQLYRSALASLSFQLLLQRLVYYSGGLLMVVALARWLSIPIDEFGLFSIGVQFWLSFLLFGHF